LSSSKKRKPASSRRGNQSRHGSNRKASRSKSKTINREDKKFLSHLSLIVYHQKELEEAKIKLAKRQDFDIEQAYYTLLDQNQHGNYRFEDFR
jgi:hypothetical protein